MHLILIRVSKENKNKNRRKKKIKRKRKILKTIMILYLSRRLQRTLVYLKQSILQNKQNNQKKIKVFPKKKYNKL
jgi:glycopeptide antibiotics resistance protein